MTRAGLARALVLWLVLMAAEVVHGVARALWLLPRVGDLRARQIGVFSGSLLVLVLAASGVRWLGITRRGPLIAVGLLWTVLTLGFELGLGRFVIGASWERVASDYDLAAGGLMPFGLLVMALAPWVAARLRHIGPSIQPARSGRSAPS